MEFDCIVQQIAATINNRPLSFNLGSEEVLTPNQLLLGRNYDAILPPDNLAEVPVTVLHSHLKTVISTWFKRWESLVLPRLYQVKKWQEKAPDLTVGDICLLHQTFGKHKVVCYKYCRVTKTIPSADGLVRTVEVKYLNFPSKRGKLTTVDVRRLTLLPRAAEEAI